MEQLSLSSIDESIIQAAINQSAVESVKNYKSVVVWNVDEMEFEFKNIKGVVEKRRINRLVTTSYCSSESVAEEVCRSFRRSGLVLRAYVEKVS